LQPKSLKIAEGQNTTQSTGEYHCHTPAGTPLSDIDPLQFFSEKTTKSLEQLAMNETEREE